MIFGVRVNFFTVPWSGLLAVRISVYIYAMVGEAVKVGVTVDTYAMVGVSVD